MLIREVCPQCKSSKDKKNGHIHNGKQNHHCHDCRRQFVQCCEPYLISADKRESDRTLAGGADFVTGHLSCSHTSAEHLWAKSLQASRQHAAFDMDHDVVYEKVIPAAQHRAISKVARKTKLGPSLAPAHGGSEAPCAAG